MTVCAPIATFAQTIPTEMRAQLVTCQRFASKWLSLSG